VWLWVEVCGKMAVGCGLIVDFRNLGTDSWGWVRTSLMTLSPFFGRSIMSESASNSPPCIQNRHAQLGTCHTRLSLIGPEFTGFHDLSMMYSVDVHPARLAVECRKPSYACKI